MENLILSRSACTSLADDKIIWSEEQLEIINKAKDNNIMCDSVAGSGKTTTILGILSTYSTDKCLILTYNARLKMDTRNKLDKYNLTNGTAESFHSFCYNNINKSIITDDTLYEYFNKNPLDKLELNLDYDRIIIDEVQDMKPLYYELVCKIITSNKNPPLIFIIGDIYQSIYGYELADERYLKYADRLFNFNKYPWLKLTLSTSYRITDTIANLLNNQFNMNRNINTVKHSEFKPRYLICNTFIENKYDKKHEIDLRILDEVKYYLNLGYKPEDIFIIANSVKSKSAVKELINLLKKEGIKTYIAEKEVNKDMAKDKIICLTYHKSKGLERKVSIVYGCDNYFFELHNNIINTICPNELYVALTRSTERLTLVQQDTKQPLPFLNMKTLEDYVDIIGMNNDKKTNNSNIRYIKSYELTDYTPNIIINKCLEFIDYEPIKITNRNPIDILNNNDLKKEENDLPNIKTSIPNLINDSLIYYFYYKKYHQNFLIDMILTEKKILSPTNKKAFEESKEFLFVKQCESNKNISFYYFIKLYHIYYCIIHNDIMELLNDNYNYNYNFKIDIVKAFNYINKIFIDEKINLLDRRLLLKDKNKCQPIINMDIDKTFILQEIINDFNINTLFDNIKDEKLNKIFNEENKTNLKIHLYLNVPLYRDDTLTFITYNKECINNDLINCVVCHNIIKNMYKIKNLNLQLFNPYINTIYKINYKGDDYIMNLLLLNRFIGFKQLTTPNFINENLNIFNKYFNKKK